MHSIRMMSMPLAASFAHAVDIRLFEQLDTDCDPEAGYITCNGIPQLECCTTDDFFTSIEGRNLETENIPDQV